MFFWICSVVDVGGPRLYLGPLYRSRILRSEPGPLHSQSDVFFFKKTGLWSKCGVLRVGRCKGLSMTCAPPTPLPCYSDPPALFRCASFPFRPSHPRCSPRPSPPHPDGRLSHHAPSHQPSHAILPRPVPSRPPLTPLLQVACLAAPCPATTSYMTHGRAGHTTSDIFERPKPIL